jgi:hypothetical protein
MDWYDAVAAGYIIAPPSAMPITGENVTVFAVWGNDNDEIWIPNSGLTVRNTPDAVVAQVEDQTATTLNVAVVDNVSIPLAPSAALNLVSGSAAGWTFLGWTTTITNLTVGMDWYEAVAAGYIVTPPATMPISGESVTVFAVWGNDEGEIWIPNTRLTVDYRAQNTPVGMTISVNGYYIAENSGEAVDTHVVL